VGGGKREGKMIGGTGKGEKRQRRDDEREILGGNDAAIRLRNRAQITAKMPGTRRCSFDLPGGGKKKVEFSQGKGGADSKGKEAPICNSHSLERKEENTN